MLTLWDTENRRVLADVLDERLEGLVTEESLDEAAITLVLFHQLCVLCAEGVTLLCLQSDFAFKLRDVFCNLLAWNHSAMGNGDTNPFS